jgi:hypothetical protein
MFIKRSSTKEALKVVLRLRMYSISFGSDNQRYCFVLLLALELHKKVNSFHGIGKTQGHVWHCSPSSLISLSSLIVRLHAVFLFLPWEEKCMQVYMYIFLNLSTTSHEKPTFSLF